MRVCPLVAVTLLLAASVSVALCEAQQQQQQQTPSLVRSLAGKGKNPADNGKGRKDGKNEWEKRVKQSIKDYIEKLFLERTFLPEIPPGQKGGPKGKQGPPKKGAGDGPNQDCSSQCKECIKRRTEGVIEHAAQELVHSCRSGASTKAPCLPVFQGRAAVTLGMLMFWNPTSLASSFCAGSGECGEGEGSQCSANMGADHPGEFIDQLIGVVQRQLNK